MTHRILVVDDEDRAREALRELLDDAGYEVRTAADGFKALGELEDWRPDVLLTDLRMPMMNGLELISKVRDRAPQVQPVVMTAYGSIDNAVDAMKAGAVDYLTKPLNFEEVEWTLDRTLERVQMRRELEELREGDEEEEPPGPTIVGNSPGIEEVVDMVRQVADSTATVLVTGESGTGKELVAERLHAESDRSNGPFVELHCAALADSLLESELFGHEEGAFTGADEAREGRLQRADGGTLFLDEVGEIPPSIQVELLRFLQKREFVRVGGNESISVDVRIVAATNRDLEKAVREGDFREDFYYRLNVIEIEIPPLRARREDIAPLVNHFAATYADRNDKSIERIDPKAMEVLESHDWPGNVRELENVVERAVVLADDEEIGLTDLPEGLTDAPFGRGTEVYVPGSTLDEIERYAILETYESTGASTSETADILGISKRKVQYKLKEYRSKWDLDLPDEGG